MAGILHQPESVADLVISEGAIWQRRQLFLGEKLADLLEDAPCQIGDIDQKLIGVDTEIADIAPERTQADLAVGVIVTLAKLQEAAEGLDQLDAPLHRFRKERIENEINTFTARKPPHAGHEIQRAGIKHVIGAEHLEEATFFDRAGRGDHLGTPVLGNLERSQTDTTGSTMDQDGLVRLNAPKLDHRIIGGQKGNRHSGGSNGFHPLRQLCHTIAMDAHMS